MKNKYAKVEGHSELIRDEMSHAIINMDDEAYRLTIRRREMMKSQKNEINTLKQEVTEIKFLLKDQGMTIKGVKNIIKDEIINGVKVRFQKVEDLPPKDLRKLSYGYAVHSIQSTVHSIKYTEYTI
mgnify:CR=1 FL=1